MITVARRVMAVVILMTAQQFLFAQNEGQKRYLHQIGEETSIHSELLGEDRTLWIQVPPVAKPYETFPVVYVLDGGQQLSALAAVHGAYWGHFFPRMILVGISNRSNRIRDLTTSKVPLGMQTGEAEKFTSFIEKELIPFMDANYPTTSYRTLIGHSLAGLFTVHVLMNHRELFQNYLAIDPSLDWDEQAFLKTALIKLKEETFDGKSLYLSLSSPLDRADASVGLDEVMEQNSDFSIAARSVLEFAYAAQENPQNGLISQWKFYPDDIHSTVPLPSMIDGLRFMFSWYQLTEIDRFNHPETSAAILQQLLEERASLLAKNFGYEVPPADEEMLLMGGMMFKQMDQLEKAGLFLKMASKYYPQSAEANAAMGEFFEEAGNVPQAIHFFGKAYEVSREESYREKVEELKEK